MQTIQLPSTGRLDDMNHSALSRISDDDLSRWNRGEMEGEMALSGDRCVHGQASGDLPETPCRLSGVVKKLGACHTSAMILRG